LVFVFSSFVITARKQGSVCDNFSVLFLFASQISQEWLNKFVPNSQGRRVWFLAQTSLNVKCQLQRSKVTKDKRCALLCHHPPAVMEWNVLAANVAMQQRPAPFRRCEGGGDFGGLCAVYVS